MATTQRRQRPEERPAGGERIAKGFDYLTLDPSPRLRKMRKDQARGMTDPAEVVRRAWQSVGTAIAEAIRTTRETSNPPSR
jgi:hypothetical protein